MNKIVERLLIFFIGLPAVIAIVLFLPYRNSLALNLVVVFFSAFGAVELSAMLVKKEIKISKIESGILGALIPASLTLFFSVKSSTLFLVLIIAGFLWVFLSRVFSNKRQINDIAKKILGSLALFIYPGFFTGFIVLMSIWGNPSAILLFLFITFGNDSLAWLFGTLFGKNNRGIIAVSPNKSIAGFIGGIIGSVLVAAIAALFFPSIFSTNELLVLNIKHEPVSSILIPVIILGFCTGIATTLGDLAESAIKRSCDFKDSGNLMLGRGGVLDSIDSIAIAAPVFFLLFTYFFYGS
ncbi:MAG: phosphatidate cytidylyltransferase [Treponema sp.]|nr:phosphatidate cytidylyltransferase [Treponema sp.]